MCVDPNLAASVAEERDRVAVGIDPERVGLARHLSCAGFGDDVLPASGALCLTQAPMEAQRVGFRAAEERTAMRSSGSSKTAAGRGSVSGGDERDALETTGGDRRIARRSPQPPDQERRTSRRALRLHRRLDGVDARVESRRGDREAAVLVQLGRELLRRSAGSGARGERDGHVRAALEATASGRESSGSGRW